MEIRKHITDTKPDTLIQKENKWQLCFNIKEKNVQGIKVFHYNSCLLNNAKNITRGIIIETIVSEKYSKGEELALINNILNEPDNNTRVDEYQEYQQIRTDAKNEADRVMESIELGIK
jgi:hypothetical protein